MPIFLYQCEECGDRIEILSPQEGVPSCCGKSMTKLMSKPALMHRTNERGRTIRSKGYKEGYAKDYAKDVPTPWNS